MRLSAERCYEHVRRLSGDVGIGADVVGLVLRARRRRAPARTPALPGVHVEREGSAADRPPPEYGSEAAAAPAAAGQLEPLGTLTVLQLGVDRKGLVNADGHVAMAPALAHSRRILSGTHLSLRVALRPILDSRKLWGLPERRDHRLGALEEARRRSDPPRRLSPRAAAPDTAAACATTRRLIRSRLNPPETTLVVLDASGAAGRVFTYRLGCAATSSQRRPERGSR